MPSINPYNGGGLPNQFMLWLSTLRSKLNSVPSFSKGDGSPEGSVKGSQGDTYFNRTGSAGTFYYLKTTDGGDTGWIAIG